MSEAPEDAAVGVSPSWVGRASFWALQALLLVTVVCGFVPFSPFMPGAELDESWAFGMNQAVAQGLAIGRDIVFTFGPYSSVYTGRYHPDTDHLMVFGALYLALSFSLALMLTSMGRRWTLLIGLCVVLAGLLNSRDALFLAYPVLVAVYCFRSNLQSDEVAGSPRRTMAFTVILFLPFGLLAAIKGTFLMLCLAVAVLAVALFLSDRQWIRAASVVVSVGVSTALFWLLAGQSLPDLPRYFVAIAEISAGYAEAMALPGVGREIAYFLIAAAVILTAIVRERRLPPRNRIFLFLSFLAFLFLAFKGGFVRHDGHATLAGAALLLGSLMLALALQSRWLPVAFLFAVVSWGYIDSHYVNTSTGNIGARLGSTYLASWNGIRNRIRYEDWLRQDYQAALKRIQDKAKMRLLPGTTDIYAYGQSELLASGNKWNPRPVFQSYSAYTSTLAARNAEHLLGAKAPDNIVFRLETVDGRLPALDDGASWPRLFTDYRLDAAEHDWLYLRRKEVPAAAAEGRVIGRGSFAFGDAVPVPGQPAPVFASISIRPTLLGRLMGIAFKPDQLQITLQLGDGSSRTFRLVSGMAKAGFLVSPLVQSTAEFGALYGGAEYLAGQEVTSFSIQSLGGGRHWVKSFDVVFREAAAVAPVDLRSLPMYRFDAALEVGRDQVFRVADRCEGFFDFVNGATPPPLAFAAFGRLAVHGWMARSVKPAIVPETAFLALSDEQDRHVLFHMRRTVRPDVGRHFQEPALDASGFAATVDTAAIAGDYRLGWAYLDQGQIILCPKSDIRGSFKGGRSRTPG